MRADTCFVVVVAASFLLHAGARPVISAPSNRAQTVALHTGERQERSLAVRESHTFEVDLAEGDFLEAAVRPRGIDVSVTFTGDGDDGSVTTDLTPDPDMSETLIIVARTAGPHQITVSGVGTDGPGRYAIEVTTIRPATPEDRVRVDAMRALEAGARILKHPEPGFRDRAAGQFDLAIEGFRKSGDTRGEAWAETHAAVSAAQAIDASALKHAERAVALCRQAPGNEYFSTALSALGLALAYQGQTPAAVQALEEALAEASERGDPRGETAILINLGLVYGRSGSTELAIEQLRRALDLGRAHNWRPSQLTALGNLGIAYKDLGDYETAARYYSAALSIARELGNKTLEANTLNNLGNLYRLLHDYARAKASHEEALTLARQVGNTEHEARALNTLGWTYYRLGDARQALEYYQQALAIRRTLNDPVALASTFDGLGLAFHAVGENDKAFANTDEGLRLRRSTADPNGEAESLSHRAELKRDRGDLDGALQDLTAAVAVTESVRGRIMSPEARASFIAAEQDTYDLYVDVLMQLDRRSPERGYAARALEASEHGRARVLLESLLQARTDIREGIDPELLASEKTYQKRLDDASRRVSALIARSAGAGQVDEARKVLENLSKDYSALEARIRRESPRYAALTQPEALSLGEIQHDLLDPDTLLLEFRLGNQQSWLWCVGPDWLHAFPLPARAEIEKAGREAYELLTARQVRQSESAAARRARIARADARWTRAARALSDMLLAPAVKEISTGWRGKRLLIVASDVLEYVPFAALPDPLEPRRSLVHGHEIVNAPSASVVSVIRRESAERPEPTGKVAVIADPVFEADDPRVPVTGRRPPALRARNSAAAENPDPPAPAFARLPFSSEEARAIAALVPASDRLEASGFKANRALATSSALENYRIVHFATHGVLDADRPELSGLVLSLIGPDGRAENGFLRTRDIYNLRLAADLVVLSACQTALGKEIRGEGIVGLTRGFMYAGARRVVASLWQVDDLATAELMRLFYRAMLLQGLPPAAALRSAQRQLASHARWSSPFYWSPFVLQGEWR